MNWKLDTVKKKFVLTFGIQVFILTVVLTLASLASQRYIKDIEWVHRAKDVESEIDRVEIKLLEKQNNIRSYSNSKNPKYIQDVTVPIPIEPLRSLVIDPVVKQMIADFEPRLRAREQIINEGIQFVNERKVMNSREDYLRREDADAKTEELRQSLKDLKTEEERVLKERTTSRDRTNKQAIYFGWGFIIVGAFVLGWAFIWNYRAAEREETLKCEIEKTNKELEQFVYIASHDLQEPLRTIASYCDLISMRYKDKLDESGKEFIDFVIQGTTKMKVLINDLLTYSRTKRELKKVDVNVKDILNSVLKVLKLEGCEIRVGRMPVVNASESALGQIFQNLLSNAVKFRKEGDCKITVRAKEQGDFWKFSVIDNGIGIKEEFYKLIFEPFKRLNPETPGSGIGLAICEKLVRAHGGKIWVESVYGEGSTFHFTIKK